MNPNNFFLRPSVLLITPHLPIKTVLPLLRILPKPFFPVHRVQDPLLLLLFLCRFLVEHRTQVAQLLFFFVGKQIRYLLHWGLAGVALVSGTLKESLPPPFK